MKLKILPSMGWLMGNYLAFFNLKLIQLRINSIYENLILTYIADLNFCNIFYFFGSYISICQPSVEPLQLECMKSVKFSNNDDVFLFLYFFSEKIKQQQIHNGSKVE